MLAWQYQPLDYNAILASCGDIGEMFGPLMMDGGAILVAVSSFVPPFGLRFDWLLEGNDPIVVGDGVSAVDRPSREQFEEVCCNVMSNGH